MNILLISPYFSPMVGGVETHLNDLCSFFSSKRHKVFVRTYKAFGVKERGFSEETRGSVRIHRLWWPDFNLIFALEKFPALKFLYLFVGLFIDCLVFLFRNSSSVEVIQAHGFIAGLIAVVLGKLFSKRVVINTHVGFNLSKGLMTDLIKFTLKASDKVLVLTEEVKKSLVNLGIPADKIIVYHYWVDQNIFSPVKNAKERLNWKDQFVVLFVGRLIAVKGVERIFDLAKEISSMIFVIIGSGPLSEYLKQKSGSYRNINFLGKVNNKDLPLYYSGANLLLIPSQVVKQEYQEGIPRVMIEGLSCGTPIISTEAGGIPDVFSFDIGKLVDDNIQSMRKALEDLYRNKSLLIKISRNCRTYALKHFSNKNGKIIEDSLLS